MPYQKAFHLEDAWTRGCEGALATFASAAMKTHGALVVAGDLFLVKSTGGELALIKAVSVTGTDRAAQAVVQIEVLIL
jgi:hypothetical protein